MCHAYSDLLFFFLCSLTLPIDTLDISIQANVGKNADSAHASQCFLSLAIM